MTGCGMWLFGVDLGSMANEDTIILWDAQGWGQEPGVLTPPWECLAGEGNSPTLQNWAPLWEPLSFCICWPSWPLASCPQSGSPSLCPPSVSDPGGGAGREEVSIFPGCFWTCLLGKEEIPHQLAGC